MLCLSIPHVAWKPVFTPRAEAMPEYLVQISRDENFAVIEDEDRLAAVITRYVPGRELPPGTYWWRVAGAAPESERGPWSAPRRFVVRPSERVFTVPAGASHRQILDLLKQAADAAPAILRFAHTTYRLALVAESLFPCQQFRDLVIDGNGATFVITIRSKLSFLARLESCQRIQFRDFTIDYGGIFPGEGTG